MPKAKVRSAAEKHVPFELVHIPEIYKENVYWRPVSDVPTMTGVEKDNYLAKAERLAVHMRELLQLGKHDWLDSTGINLYTEFDADGRKIAENGALYFKPRIMTAAGTLQTRDVLWVDAEHRPPSPLTEEDMRLAGQVALTKDVLGSGWHSHRLDERATTPRDALYAAELAPVIPIRLIVAVQPAVGQSAIA